MLNDLSQTPKTSEDRTETFKPVSSEIQLQSGEKLLVEAYIVFWFIVLALVFVGWRRQNSLETRLLSLEEQLKKKKDDT